MAARRFSGNFAGVVLFVDTSGFTALTATLTAHGKEGAEILADILLAVMDPLIESVYAHGGFVAGFAGDAFKAIFPGDRHQRAWAAAAEIRQRMADTPTHTTPYGTFTFAVRASIADGDVTWQIWAGGDLSAAQTHAYTFAGEAIDRAVQGEDHAQTGELIVTDAVYARLRMAQDGSLSAVPLTGSAAGYWRIDAAPGAPPARLNVPTPTVEDDPASAALAAAFYPADLLATTTRGEFRPVVSVFCNVQSLESAGGDFMRVFFRLLHQYGGYLCRVGRIGANDAGGTFLLFWGAPTTHENDLDRALGFLLDLQEQTEVPLRAGVTYGVAFAGFIGSPLREEYTCYGLRVNLAARQMAAADWDEIWLDEETARRARAFDVVSAGRSHFKGFADEHPVFHLRGRREHVFVSYRRGLVGREEEVTQLWRAMQPLFAGRFGGVTVVTGEAGIGKSRLLFDLRQRLAAASDDEIRWFYCPADEILRQPLNPFRYGLRDYFGQVDSQSERENKAYFDRALNALIGQTSDATLRAELARTRSFLGALVDLYWPDSLYAQVDPRLRFENTISALKTFFLAESLRQPLVVELEDLHWVDDDSRRFLQHLLRDIDEYPLTIIASSREDLDSDLFGAAVTPRLIALRPLAEDALQRFAEQQLARPAAPALVALLSAQSEGNPFFAEQILLYMQEENLLVETEEGLAPVNSAAHLPTDVQSVLVARLDRLARTVKDVVQTAAVLGREFAVQVLSQMLREMNDVAGSLRVGEAESIWTALDELRYLFRHALLREAAYEMQLRARLRHLHRLAAEAIEQLYAPDLAPHYADLVYHYRRAELPGPERTYARLAGQQAAEQFANAEAVAYFSRALALTGSEEGAERFDLLAARARVYHVQGAREAQRADLDAMAELARALADPVRQAEAALAYADYAEATSNYPAAVASAQEALDAAASAGNYRLQSKAHQHWARALWRQGQYAESEVHGKQALALAQADGLRELEADALIVLGIARWFVGDYTQAQTYLEQSLPIYADVGDRFAPGPPLLNLGLIAQSRGDHDAALTYLHRALAIYRETGDRQHQGIALTNIGLSQQRLGEYEQAMETQQRALRLFDEMGEQFGVMVAQANLGSIYLDLGDPARARRAYSQALDLCRQIGSRGYDSLLMAILAEIDFDQGASEAVYARLQQALTEAREVGHRDNEAKILNKVGRVALALNQFDEAEAAYTQALAIRRELGQTVQSMEALAGLAEVRLDRGDTTGATACVAEILAYLEAESLDGARDPFQIYLTCYRVLQAAGDARAVELLDTAHRLLQARASQIRDDERRRSFLENVPAHRTIVQASADRQ